MKATTTLPAKPAKEPTKQRALRIRLDYHRRGGSLVRSKYFWTLVAAIGAVAYIVFLFWGREPAATQLSPAPLASVHATLEAKCSQCHVDYVPLNPDGGGLRSLSNWFAVASQESGAAPTHVGNAQCIQCHKPQAKPHHAQLRAEDGLSCSACHAEHRGRATDLTRINDEACTNCHENIAAHVADTENGHSLVNVKSFAPLRAGEFAHPPFRSLPKADDNNFQFNHQLHMLPGQWPRDGKPSGAWTLDKIPEADRDRYRTRRLEFQSDRSAADSQLVQLDCASCHEPERGDSASKSGAHMQPINFERHCRACHPLQVVDSRQQVIDVRHGLKQQELRELLVGFAESHKAQYPQQSTPHISPNTPIPGKTPGNNIAQNLSESALPELWHRRLFQEACLKCHTEGMLPDNDASPKQVAPLDFAPPRIPERWFKQAHFDHGAHRAWVDCQDCHAGAYATAGAAKPALDDARVLIPDIDNCVRCHAPASQHPTFRASARFDCAECHRYHAGAQ